MNKTLNRLLNELILTAVHYTQAEDDSKEEYDDIEKMEFIKSEIQKLVKENSK